jgi:acyl carrier protein
LNIEQRVKEIAAELFGVEVTNETALQDSLQLMQFVLTLEDEFNIEIEDEAAEQLDTIQGFVDLVTNLKGAE